jgi:flagellar protein FliS
MMYEPNLMARNGANLYARVGLESGVMSASPHKIISMLFSGAKTSIVMARHHMAQGEIAAKGKAISKAINIIDNGLKTSFDVEATEPEAAALVANLLALFEYIGHRLLLANLRNDASLLDEAERLLDSISSAWQEMDPQHKQAAQDAANKAAAVHVVTGA